MIWQVLGLANFLDVGSSASKENDDRKEAKIDALLRLQGAGQADELIARMDERYLRHGGHARPHAHELAYPESKGPGTARGREG